jgi:predicted transcriptional regulator
LAIADSASATHRGLMLLSIHARHAEQIALGNKTVELRRTRPKVLPGQPIAIYATLPTAAVVATCRVLRVESLPICDVSQEVLDTARVTDEEFQSYFSDRSFAYLIHLMQVDRLSQPIELTQIRRNEPFAPPQTWLFLDRRAASRLFLRHPAAGAIDALLG